MGILNHDEILEVHEVAVSAGLTESRSTLLAGIDLRFVATLPQATNLSEQLLRDLDTMNIVGTLANESMPLTCWLENALALTANRTCEVFFRKKLARCRTIHPSTEPANVFCPFPGLEFFNEERADLFFGREEDTEKSISFFESSQQDCRWLQIEGPSGAGKSSLVRAGLVPRIRNKYPKDSYTTWQIAIFRPGADPLLNLAHAIIKVLGRGEIGELDKLLLMFRSSETSLLNFLRERVPEAHGFLLVVDQLEEAIIFFEARSHDRGFDGILARAILDKEGPLHLITTIRSDFVGRFGALPKLERLLNKETARYYLKAMDSSNLRAVIEKPADRVGLVWQDGLPERIIEETAALGSGGALPPMAHLLRAIWANRTKNVLTHEAYDLLGGVGGALAQSADDLIENLAAKDQSCARRMLLALVRTGRGTTETRKVLTRAELLDAADCTSAERVLATLSGGRSPDSPTTRLALPRLIVVSNEYHVELVHETLIRRWAMLAAWINEDRKNLECRDDVESAAQAWEAAGRPDGGLPTGGQLAYFKNAVNLSQLGQKFLQSAQKLVLRHEQQQQQRVAKQARQQRRVILTLAGVVIAVSGLATYAFHQRSIAEKEKARAESRLNDALRVAQHNLFTVDSKLANIKGAEALRSDISATSVLLVDRLISSNYGNDDAFLMTRFMGVQKLAETAEKKGDMADAVEKYKEAVVIGEGIDSQIENLGLFQIFLPQIYINISELQLRQHMPKEARVNAEKALVSAAKVTDAYHDIHDYSGLSAIAHGSLGAIALDADNTNEALEHLRRAASILEKLKPTEIVDGANYWNVAVVYVRLGDAEFRGRHTKEGVDAYHRARDIFATICDQTPDDVENFQRLISVYLDLFRRLSRAGEYGKAVDVADEAIGSMRARRADQFGDREIAREFISSLNKLANEAANGTSLIDAERALGLSLDFGKELLVVEPANIEIMHSLCEAEFGLGNVVLRSGNLKAALSHLAESLKLAESLVEKNPNEFDYNDHVVSSSIEIGKIAIRDRDFKLAKEVFIKALPVAEKMYDLEPIRYKKKAFVVHFNLGYAGKFSNDFQLANAHLLVAERIFGEMERSGAVASDPELLLIQSVIRKHKGN